MTQDRQYAATRLVVYSNAEIARKGITEWEWNSNIILLLKDKERNVSNIDLH